MLTKIANISIIFLVILCTGLTFVPPQTEGVLTLEFIGSFHPLILHLPIGLWVGVMAILFWKTFDQGKMDLIYWGTVFTIITGALAFLTGLNLYWAGGYAKETLLPHMYGALLFLAGLATFAILVNKGVKLKGLWTVAIGSMVALGAAGHVGGVITHGDPMDKAPWVVKEKRAAEATLAEEESSDGALENPIVFQHVVMPILEEKCISCHSSERAKGKLRMDSYAALIQGGSKGTSLVPGDAQKSLMLERVHLPLDNKEHMPPKSKPQVTPEELSFLEWWVNAGAERETPVLEANIPEEHSALVQSHIGDDPEAIARRQQKEQQERLLKIHHEIAAEFPGIVTPTIAGEAEFELSNASLYGYDEARLIEVLPPLMPYVVRIDWHNKEISEEWFALFNECKNLNIINLNQAKVNNAQVESLITNNLPLEKVNLYGVPITDALIPTLTAPISKGQLRSLIIAQTHVTEQGKAVLRGAIPKTTIID